MPYPTSLELYQLLLKQLEYDDSIRKQFGRILEENDRVLDERKYERDNPVLTFRVFDNLRNSAARTKALEEVFIQCHECIIVIMWIFNCFFGKREGGAVIK